MIWTKKLIEEQGFKIKLINIYQDNQSTIKLATNGKESSGKCTRHFDIKYFYLTDLIKYNKVSIKFCPSKDMIIDYLTTPLVGEKFWKQRNKIMNNNDWKPSLVSRSMLLREYGGRRLSSYVHIRTRQHHSKKKWVFINN